MDLPAVIDAGSALFLPWRAVKMNPTTKNRRENVLSPRIAIQRLCLSRPLGGRQYGVCIGASCIRPAAAAAPLSLTTKASPYPLRHFINASADATPNKHTVPSARANVSQGRNGKIAAYTVDANASIRDRLRRLLMVRGKYLVGLPP